ncbi:hypothetical protein EON65_03210 [archaeon]|nr:MAG: hypothetical protein EON65_03210 [archaeon]
MMEVAKNEVQLLQSVWQRHYDIINLQISYIMDELNNLEIDPRSLPYFQDDFDESREHFHDKAARLEADKEVAAQIAQRNSIDREKQDDEEDSDEHHSDDGMDEIDGEDVKDTLGLMKMQADDDDLVLKFVQHNDIPKSAYPSVFEKTVPVEVLKALAYAS